MAQAEQTSRRSLGAARSSGESRRTVLIALGANAAIMVAKLFGGLVSGSASMLAEAAHSLADTTNQAFLLVSIGLSKREPTPSRPFGSGQERFLWTFVAAVGMFLAGSIFAIGYGTYELLAGPEKETDYLVPFVVLGLAFLAEATSWTRAMRQTRREAEGSGKPALRYARESRDPNVKMVLFEDSAALAGIALAAAGLAANALTGARIWDPIASIAIGLMLVFLAFWMGRDAKHLLIGAAARPEERRALEEAIEGFPEVREARQLLTMTLGPKALLVAARVDLADEVPAGEVERVSSEIDERLREAVPDVTEVFIDATPGREGAAPA
jgi:cation diffusion facilitator family transporter